MIWSVLTFIFRRALSDVCFIICDLGFNNQSSAQGFFAFSLLKGNKNDNCEIKISHNYQCAFFYVGLLLSEKYNILTVCVIILRVFAVVLLPGPFLLFLLSWRFPISLSIFLIKSSFQISKNMLGSEYNFSQSLSSSR